MVHAEVERFCLDRLRDAFNDASALFDRQLRHGTWGPTRGSESITSTAIALIGLSRASIPPSRIGLDCGRTHEALLERAARRGYRGALGLILWANSVTSGPAPAATLGRLGCSLDDLSLGAASWQTMEVAWLLSGLSHALASAPSESLRRALRTARTALLGRFVASSQTFLHATAAARPLRRLRRRVANFADQIYAIQALALACTQENDDAAMEVAARAAGRMIALQGSLGQWWWHYDACAGTVAQAYPVYSVHQYGMAPMALVSLARTGGPSHDQALALSQSWLGANELGTSLIDHAAGTIWRAIERDEGPLVRLARRAGSVLGHQDRPLPGAGRFRVNRETRPYEWAWYLFAAALGRGYPPDSCHLI
jgi:hypothetical protein